MRTCSDNIAIGKDPGKIIPAFSMPMARLPGSHNGGQLSGPLSLLGRCLIGVPDECASWQQQARMHERWFFHDGSKVTQPMVYPADIRQIQMTQWASKLFFVECGLYMDRCEANVEVHIGHLLRQADSELSQISGAKITCARGNWSRRSPLYSLLKFHCKLNFIEFFWRCQEIPYVTLWFTHLTLWRRTCWKPWSPWSCKQSAVGAPECINGWMLTERSMGQQMLRTGEDVRLQKSTNHTGVFRRMFAHTFNQ